MKITEKYLMALTDEHAPEQTVTATDESGKTLFQLQIRTCPTGQPYYLNVERLRGQNVFFRCGEEDFRFDAAVNEPEEVPCLRPQQHFTVPYGWLNDPNGLVFFNGEYHIFCQHNPLGTAWGNMHWHHSTTTDFARFAHHGDVLFPDEKGTMFSGSAVCDTQNVSGLGKDTLLLYYTIAEYPAAGQSPRFSQGLAFSADGVHFTKYAGNPVVPNIKGENRDPKVVYVPEMSAYVMALYLDGDAYGLLQSDNLLQWSMLQTIHLPGDAECPDLYYLKDSGKWVFSGASDTYLVGHFESTGFVPEQPPRRFFRALDGRRSYAAQSFSGLENRVLRLTWESFAPAAEQRFCGQLSVPMAMSLATMQDGTRRLKASLCRELESRLTLLTAEDSTALTVRETAFVADIDISEDGFVRVDDTVLTISVTDNTITYGEAAIPLSLSGGRQLRLVVDRLSVELLADDGLIFSCVPLQCAEAAYRLTASGGKIRVFAFD